MTTKTQVEATRISIPISLPQIAEGLRQLSSSDFETLELLLDKKALRTIEGSLAEARRWKMKGL